MRTFLLFLVYCLVVDARRPGEPDRQGPHGPPPARRHRDLLTAPTPAQAR
ncbi:hypothetical protein LT493_20625 [Streptomyces tricolor]|nr:hypothetical protein [Streptomyces tricolor]